MIIKKLSFTGLYGYLDKQIDFNPDINLLVGINGSGKTSVLNLISWVLQPSIPHLCTTPFKEIALAFNFQQKEWQIRCTQTASEFKLFLEVIGKPCMHPLVVQLHRPPSSFSTRSEMLEFLTNYDSLGPDKDEQNTWMALQKLPSPIVVGLERTLGLEKRELRVAQLKATSKGRIPQPIDPVAEMHPLRKLQQLASQAFGKYRGEMLKTNELLRDKIMLSAFDLGVLPGTRTRTVRKATLLNEDQITTLEGKFEKYFAQDSHLANKRDTRGRSSLNRTKVAARYFERLKKLLAQTKMTTGSDSAALWDVIHGQVKKLNRLFIDFEKFEADSERAHLEIKKYLGTLNHFFRDSAKNLHFKTETGMLGFSLVNRDGQSDKSSRSIELLSSGEKQILTLLTYMAFSPGKIFVIDEPELSLHPKWQEDFLEKVMAILPKGTQLILATHSPAIVGRNVELCKPLSPFNK